MSKFDDLINKVISESKKSRVAKECGCGRTVKECGRTVKECGGRKAIKECGRTVKECGCGKVCGSVKPIKERGRNIIQENQEICIEYTCDAIDGGRPGADDVVILRSVKEVYQNIDLLLDMLLSESAKSVTITLKNAGGQYSRRRFDDIDAGTGKKLSGKTIDRDDDADLTVGDIVDQNPLKYDGRRR